MANITMAEYIAAERQLTADSIRAFIPTLFTSEGHTMSRIYAHVTMNCRTCDIDPNIHESIARVHYARSMEAESNDIVTSMSRHYGETSPEVDKYRDIVRTCEAIVAAAFNDLVTLVNDAHARPFNLTTATIHAFGTGLYTCEDCRALDLTSMTDREFVAAVNERHQGAPTTDNGDTILHPGGLCDWCMDQSATRVIRDVTGFTNYACEEHAATWTLCNDTVSVIIRSKNV